MQEVAFHKYFIKKPATFNFTANEAPAEALFL